MSDNEINPEPTGLLSPSADAHGQAALVLVESLIHGLVERSVLTTVDAIEIIEGAKEVQADVAEAADGAGAKMWHSHGLLSAMSRSLQYDMDGTGN
jgi:hypothetical protein